MGQQPKKRGAAAPAPQDSATGVQNTDVGGIFVDRDDATDLAPREFAEGNPTGFVENMKATFDSTLRTGLMVSKARSKANAYEPIMAEINKGLPYRDQLVNPYLGESRGGAGRIRQRNGVFGIDFSGGWMGVTPEEQEATVWAEIGRRRAKDPGFLPGIPATRDELYKKIDDADRQALEADEDVNRRATTWGSAGSFVGGVGASFRDPINVLSLPLGAGASKTILGAALKQGGINAALTAVAQPTIAERNRELGREYGLDEAVTSTLYGGVGGVVLGGGAKGIEKGTRMLGNRIGRARMHRITTIAESGGRELDDAGNVITSRAGARGSMQVLDGTNTDPGFGVKPARDNSLAERARVGRDYLDAMMRRYGNDPAKAWGAYNWGAGNLDKAIAKHGAAWLEHAPAETRKYVRNNLRALGVPEGAGLPPATADQVSAAVTLEGLDELGRTSPLPATPAGLTRHLETLQGHIDALEEGAPRPEASVAPMELKRPDAVQLDRYDPRTLVVDPERFQFKGGGDEKGVLDTLRGVQEWNPILSGKAVVWVDEAGVPHVADGHQRVGLANRLIGENPNADIAIDAVTLRAADGITAEQARTWAALKNVAEGSGSPIDAAKVLRAAGDRAPIPLPPRSALVRDARAIAALSDDAFGMVVNEVVPPAYAAIVGRLAPGAPELHAAYLQLLHRLEPATLTQADSIVRQAIAAGATRETQLGLFGEEIVSRSLYLERARVLDNSLRRLKNDKRVFRTLLESKDDIEGAGNVLATDANAAKVENNAQALDILTRLAHRTGPVSDALGSAAAELAAGRSAKAAVDRFLAELRGIDLPSLVRGVERSDRDGLATGGLGRESGVEQPLGGMDREPAGGDAAAGAGRADDGLGEPIGTDLFGNPVYAERIDALDELDGPAVLEAAVDEAQEGLQLEAFADPHGGAGVARQTEILEHDVRLDADRARQRMEERRPSSQDSAAGETNGSEPRSDNGSGGRESAEADAATGRQPEGEPASARTPEGEETTKVGLPANRTKEAIISPPDERAAPTGDDAGLFPLADRVNPQTGARQAEMVQLQAQSPLRSVAEQADVDGLALFDQARSPELFALSDRLDAERGAVPELRTADDLLAELDAEDAAIKAIQECMI